MFLNKYNLGKHIKIISDFYFSELILISCLIAISFFPSRTLAGDVSSTNYTIFANSPNTGGARSTSTNFVLESTLGELSGVTTSTNYSSRSGFQAIEAEPRMTMALSENSIDLGNLSSGAVSTDSLTVTMTTNAPSGYNVKISEDDDLHSGSNDIDDVADSSVTAGYEEYGITTSGAAGQFNSIDTAISGTLTVASNSSHASAEQTTITFKASIDSATFNGSYSHVVTFTAVANF